MDPDVALLHFIRALEEEDDETAKEYHDYLSEWLVRGGFEPDWSRVEWPGNYPELAEESNKERFLSWKSEEESA